MKILVFADSHSSLFFMKRAISILKPDSVVHLGDHYDDGVAMSEEFPNIVFHIVPGNCDSCRTVMQEPLVRCYDVCGVKLFMTHGHVQSVKTSLYRLIHDARSMRAQAALYGHTHIADCHMEDEMWVLNPGSCGYERKSAGLIEVDHGEIIDCKIVYELDLEV